ncbi:ABC transporter ATP-binding protein [Acidicapsa acidisoli]|uniref:ABC transporter ATP-binding protein n=1 Tax=Acidicapsa acidisoli TaxID=1615681 RepID=UPI0021DFE3B5|nr:ATP-binding cassette domain-containing protein [Acidicapsa acidisoli]
MSDATRPEPANSDDSDANQPSLLDELNELQSPTTVSELEIASASASALISEAVAEAQANGKSVPEPTPPPFIDFDQVSIAFGDRKILDKVSFHVGRGQTLCILGRSGVGKSVSLRILLGFLKADSGSIRVDGQEISTLGESGLQEIRKHVTMVFQNGALFDSLSVGENIAFPLREKGGLFEDQIQQLVTRLLNLVGAGETANLLPSSLSTGQKRCIAIARALAAQPEAILYDEPTTMVDPIMGRSIGDLIQRLKLQLGITSIVVTHDMRFAIRLADLVLFLDSGTARFFGTIHDFLECPDPHVQQFFTLDEYALPQPHNG